MGSADRRLSARVRVMWDRLNDIGMPAMAEFFAPDFIRHTFATSYGLDVFTRIIEERRAGFSDLQTTVYEVVDQGDGLLAYRWETKGRHTGTYLSIPPTLREVTVMGITISRFDGELIAEDWSSWSEFGVLHGLGVMPVDF